MTSYKQGEVYTVEKVNIPIQLFKSLEGRRLIISSIEGSMFSRAYRIYSTYTIEDVTCKLHTELTKKQMKTFFQLKKEKNIEVANTKTFDKHLNSINPSYLESILE
jgi:hypothetical protein